jgi:hypothetical protein
LRRNPPLWNFLPPAAAMKSEHLLAWYDWDFLQAWGGHRPLLCSMLSLGALLQAGSPLVSGGRAGQGAGPPTGRRGHRRRGTQQGRVGGNSKFTQSRQCLLHVVQCVPLK